MKIYLGLVFCAVLMLGQGTASAKSVSGKIAAVDSRAGVMEVAQQNGGEKVVVGLTMGTSFSGVASAAELRPGDQVSLDADLEASSGKWTATTVKVSQA